MGSSSNLHRNRRGPTRRCTPKNYFLLFLNAFIYLKLVQSCKSAQSSHSADIKNYKIDIIQVDTVSSIFSVDRVIRVIPADIENPATRRVRLQSSSSINQFIVVDTSCRHPELSSLSFQILQATSPQLTPERPHAVFCWVPRRIALSGHHAKILILPVLSLAKSTVEAPPPSFHSQEVISPQDRPPLRYLSPSQQLH